MQHPQPDPHNPEGNMQVALESRALADALKLVKAGVPRKNATAVLAGAKLTAALGQLTVTTTDLGMIVRTSVPATVAAEGEALVRFSDLAKIIKGKGPVELRSVGDRFHIDNGSSMALDLLELDEYPETGVENFPSATSETVVELPIELLSAIAVAASRDETRPILTGVYFDGTDIVATDSYRLHIARVADAEFPKALIPWNVLAQVAKHGQPARMRLEMVDYMIGWGGNEKVGGQWARHATIETDRITWHARCIEGDYPNYRSLVPADHQYPYQLITDRLALLEAVKDAKPLCKDHTPVRLELFPDHVHVHAGPYKDDDDEETVRWSFEKDLPAAWTGPSELVAGFNPTFLADALLLGDRPAAVMSILDGLKPALVHEGADRPWGKLIRLLMPIRVS